MGGLDAEPHGKKNLLFRADAEVAAAAIHKDRMLLIR
jgi:hypothetical protein